MDGSQSELESFRQQWREEVSARLNSQTEEAGASIKPPPNRPGRAQNHRRKTSLPSNVGYEGSGGVRRELEGQISHDLSIKEDALKLGTEGGRTNLHQDKEPHSALEHYVQAVRKEEEGRLGESVNLYRKAFKLDSRVHEIYKNTYFPPSASTSKLESQNMSNSSAAVPNVTYQSENAMVPISELMKAFALLSIPPALSPTDNSPASPCPIASIPEEILREIYQSLAITDVAAFSRLAQVCKRFAYLVMTEESVWKRVALGSNCGMAGMHYSYACDLYGVPLLEASTTTLDFRPHVISTIPDLTPSTYATYRAQFRHRPRIRFNGCYISTVNYTRPGAASPSQLTWNSPIHIVTYYRYLRFFRDGTVISLQSTAEPADVVHHLMKENLHKQHSGALPSAVMKDALHGRWRLSGVVPPAMIDLTDLADIARGPGEYMREHLDAEDEGVVFVETEGVVPKYMWKMEFGLSSSGRKDGARNNKLTWRGFWSYNRLADDWGEFRLKNDRAFYWSRVKSYGID